MPPCGIPQPQLGSPQPAAAFPALTNPKFSTSCAPAVYRPGVGSIFHGVRSPKAPFTAAADPERPSCPGTRRDHSPAAGGDEQGRAEPRGASAAAGRMLGPERVPGNFLPQVRAALGRTPSSTHRPYAEPSRAVLCSALPCRPAPCRAVPCPSPAARAQCAPAPSPLRIGPRRPHITEARRGD